MRIRFIDVAFAATSLVAGHAVAQEPVRLDKATLESLLPGRTLNYTNPNGSSVHATFSRDGRYTYKSSGTPRDSLGTWSIADDGRYCAKVTTGAASDHCRTVFKGEKGYMLRNRTGEFIPVSGLD